MDDETVADASATYHLELAMQTIALLQGRFDRLADELAEIIELRTFVVFGTGVRAVDVEAMTAFAEHIRSYAEIEPGKESQG